MLGQSQSIASHGPPEAAATTACHPAPARPRRAWAARPLLDVYEAVELVDKAGGDGIAVSVDRADDRAVEERFVRVG
jgi:hypothetical protein